jgi:hypothetical protein
VIAAFKARHSVKTQSSIRLTAEKWLRRTSMSFCPIPLLFAVSWRACATLGPAGAKETARIEIHADFSEADAVMAILAKRSASLAITDADWETLFKTEAYQRLKKREASMHRDFSDADFAQFIRSDALLERRSALVRTVSEWKRADLREAAAACFSICPPKRRSAPRCFRSPCSPICAVYAKGHWRSLRRHGIAT